MTMKINFQGRGLAAGPDGLPVRYGPARRSIPRLRWLLVILIASSPLIYVLWLLLRGGLVVDAAGRLTYETLRAGSVVSGVVEQVLVEENDSVRTGTPLIRLENPEIRGRLAHLQQELSRLEVEQNTARERAERELTAINQEIETLQRLISAEDQWLRRLDELTTAGLATEREQYQAAAEGQKTRRQLIEALHRRSDLERIRSQGDINLRTREEELRLAIDIARNNLNYLLIKAPSDGDIVALQAEPGDTVGPGSTLLTMTRPSEPELIAYLRPSDGGFARQHSRVKVRLPDGSHINGQVAERPRLTGRIPAAIQSILQESSAALMVKIALVEPVPQPMAIHGLPVRVEFARGPSVALSRMRFPSAIAGQSDANALQ